MEDQSNVIHLLNQTVRLLNKRANEALQEFDLYHSQWSILYCLGRKGKMTQTDISKYLNVEAPTVTRTVQKLEANGWVIRTKGADKRQNFIELSSKSKMLMPEIKEKIKSYEAKQLLNLQKDELAVLDGILNKIMKEA